MKLFRGFSLVLAMGVSLLIGTGEVSAKPPAAPTRLRQVSATDSSATIRWNDASMNETQFQIFRRVTPDFPGP